MNSKKNTFSLFAAALLAVASLGLCVGDAHAQANYPYYVPASSAGASSLATITIDQASINNNINNLYNGVNNAYNLAAVGYDTASYALGQAYGAQGMAASALGTAGAAYAAAQNSVGFMTTLTGYDYSGGHGASYLCVAGYNVGAWLNANGITFQNQCPGNSGPYSVTVF